MGGGPKRRWRKITDPRSVPSSGNEDLVQLVKARVVVQVADRWVVRVEMRSQIDVEFPRRDTSGRKCDIQRQGTLVRSTVPLRCR